MLIPNISSSPVPVPAASNGSAGLPVSGISVSPSGNAAVAPPQAALPSAAGTQAAQPNNAQATQPTNAQIQSAVDKINEAMQQANTGVEFSIDQASDKTLVKVVDTKTGETIKQFPSKEMLAISQSIDQFQKGLLIKQNV
ncbi:MAG: flagellar protein FlaG [Gallionella sp.]